MRSLLTAVFAVAGSLMFWAASPAAGTAGATTETSTTLENIVVTATRREESVQSVPISINAIGQEELATGGITSIEDISRMTPGLQFALPNGFSQAFTTISMRGLNTNTGPPTVGVYLDDTTVSSRLSGTANQGNVYPYSFDLNRVEVARGPQGTLFGAGSEAGTVRFITNQPSLTDFSGLLKGELAQTEGGRASYEMGIAMGGPIIPNEVGYRFSAWERSDGGYVNHINPIPGPGYLADVAPNSNTNKKTVIKGALAFQVGDFLVTPAYYYQRTHQDDSGRFYAAFSDAQNGIFNNGTLLPEVWTDRWNMESIKAEDKSLPFADLTIDGSYFYREATEVLDESAFVCPGMHTPFPGGAQGCGNPLGIGYPSSLSQVAYTPTNLNVAAYTAEARLASNSKDSRFSWVAGFYFEHRAQRDFQIDYDPADYPQAFGSPPPSTALNASIIQDQHELFVDVQTAVFVQGDFRITDALTATVGERVARVTVDGAATTSLSAFTGAPAYAPFHGQNNPATPHLGLEYKINPDDLVYATFGEGYRPGGGNGAIPNTSGSCKGQPQVPATYAPDSVHAFEVGTKDTFLNGRLQVDASIFYNSWRGIQQYISEACGPYAYGTNAGSAVSDGLDLQLRAILTPELRFDMNAAFVNAYYTQNAYIPYNGTPATLPGPGTLIVGKGDKVGILPQVIAPWNINATLTYELPVNGNDKFHASATTLYTSQSPGPFITQNVGSPNYYPLATPDPATHLYNGRAGYTLGKLDLTMFINNIFNNTPALSKYQANNTPGYNLLSYTTFRPRTIGVTANYSF